MNQTTAMYLLMLQGARTFWPDLTVQEFEAAVKACEGAAEESGEQLTLVGMAFRIEAELKRRHGPGRAPGRVWAEEWQDDYHDVPSERYLGPPMQVVKKAPVEMPDWVDWIDCGQVGHTVTGRLVAYDYGN